MIPGLEGFSEYGLAALFMYLGGKEFFSILSRRARNGHEDDRGKWRDLQMQITDIQAKTGTLFDMHNVKDSEGRPIWYFHPSMERAIEKLAESIDRQTLMLSKLIGETKDTRRDVESLREKVES